MAMCTYKNCTNVQLPFSKLSFFALPKDERRSHWILNSGNDGLKSLPIRAKRLFCENHFDPKHLRRQFNRTILYRNAVPLVYQKSGKKYLPNLKLQDTINTIYNSKSCIADGHNQQKNSHSFNSNYNPMTDNCFVKETNPFHFTEPILTDGIIHNDINHQSLISTNDTIIADRQSENTFITESLSNVTNSNELLIEFHSLSPSSSLPPSPSYSESTKSEINVDVQEEEEHISEANTSTQNYLPKIIFNSDKFFASTMFGALRRLSLLQQKTAKLQILTYLTRLEYGEISTLE